MAGSQRLKRMGDQVQRELSDLIRSELKDPRLGGLVTISTVKVSPDMGYAEIYVTVMGRELADDQTAQAHKDTLEVLNGAAGFLRRELGRRVKTRITPHLRFHYDNVTAHGNYMMDLIAKAVGADEASSNEDSASEETISEVTVIKDNALQSDVDTVSSTDADHSQDTPQDHDESGQTDK